MKEHQHPIQANTSLANPGGGPNGLSMRPPGGGIVQRVVKQYKRGNNRGKWYIDRFDYDSKEVYDTQSEAQAVEDAFLLNMEEENQNKRDEQLLVKRKRYDDMMESKYANYEPPVSKKTRLYKGTAKAGKKETQYDDVSLTTLNQSNVKTFTEKAFTERWSSDGFSTQVVKMNDRHYVLAPGTDIGMTPALLRPDLEDEENKDLVPLKRDSTPKKYSTLASTLDAAVQRLLKVNNKLSLVQIRARMGADLDRFTRGSEPEGTLTYQPSELETMQELAMVLRLDKGRVPNATKYIRDTIRAGTHSFTDLFVNNKYVGAGTGGVEALRKKIVDDGNESDGSDIEEDD